MKMNGQISKKISILSYVFTIAIVGYHANITIGEIINSPLISAY